MVKIVALLGDYWHNADEAKAGLQAAIARLENKNVNFQYITHKEVSKFLDEKPDLFINAKMDPLNPENERVYTWLTDALDKKIVHYVENGGNVLAWHAGSAGYAPGSNYIHMLRGYFDYHPPGLQDVTYMLKENEKSGGEYFFPFR